MSGDAVWLDVLPSLKGFASTLVKESTAASKKAGQAAGKEWGKSFDGAAGDAGTDAVVKELEAASKKTKGIVQQQTEAISKARAAQKDAAAKVVEAEDKLTRARESGDTSKVAAAELRLEAARSRAEATTRRFESVEDQLKSAQREHKTVTEQLERATKDLKDETDKANKEAKEGKSAWGDMSDALKSVKSRAGSAVGEVGALTAKLAGAAGAAAAFASSWSQVVELDASTDQVTASLGLTEEQSARAGDAAGSLYAQAWGDSIGDVSMAVEAVMGSISEMRDATTSDLESVTAAALDLEKAMRVDVAESSRNVGVWIKEGLVADATEGYDLLTASLQKVAPALRGEVVDASHEYATFFAQLGLDGPQAMDMLVKASENGQYYIDKTGDALKELTIRSTDMSTASVEAYEAAGLSAEEMSRAFLTGGDTAAGAMDKLVTGLLGIEDPTLRANSAIALFGTPIEDLGTENIPTFLEQLAGMGDGLSDIDGRAAEMGDTLNDNMATSLEAVKRQFGGLLSEGIEPLLPVAQAFLSWAQDNPGVLKGVGAALSVLAVAWGVYTVAQWAANAAMLANPMTWVVAGIAVLVGAAVWLASNWEDVSARLTDAWDWVKDKLGAGWDWIKTNVFQRAEDAVGSLGDAFDSAQRFIGESWGKIKAAAAKPVNFIIETVYNNGIKALWDKIAGAVGLDSLKLPTVAPIGGFATGGYTGDGGKNEPAGVVHRGEFVIQKERVPRFRSLLEAIHEGRDLPGLPGYASGGEVGGTSFWDRAGGVVSGIGRGIKDLVVDAARVLSDPVGSLTSMLKAPVEALMGQVTGGKLGQLLIEIPRQAVTGIIAKAKDMITASFGSEGGEPAQPLSIKGGPWTRPSRGIVTSRYGSRWGAFHNGIDFGGNLPVYAAGAGVVARTGWNVGYGNTGLGVRLSHGNGLETYYGHADPGEIKVRAGQAVRLGQHISWGGNTGNSTGQHLHFSVFQNGRAINPATIGVYDQGGVLQPHTAAVNLSDRPERVLTDAQWRGIATLAARGARPQRQLTIQVTNPVRETAEQSITRALAKVAYLGLDEED